MSRLVGIGLFHIMLKMDIIIRDIKQTVKPYTKVC